MTGPRPDTPSAWLGRARSDLALAEVALRTAGVMAEDACFHAQQCAEKALKALLVHRGIAFPRTHMLEMLFDRTAESGAEVPVSIDAIVGLTQYAVETRYPGAWELIDAAEA